MKIKPQIYDLIWAPIFVGIGLRLRRSIKEKIWIGDSAASDNRHIFWAKFKRLVEKK